MAIQQGVFIFPCHITKSFEENLCMTFNLHFNTLNTDNAEVLDPNEILSRELYKHGGIIKLIIPKDIHFQALWDLRQMNISKDTLFPGLDGFADSLKFYLRSLEFYKEVLKFKS